MKVIQIISPNKKTKRIFNEATKRPEGYKARIGYAEAIVEENGVRKTKHMIKVEEE